MAMHKDEIFKRIIKEAMQCKSVEELMAFAEAKGLKITKDEAEAYFAELEDSELDTKVLGKIAGGDCYSENNFEPCNNFQVA